MAKYYIYGHEVSQEVYEKYANKKFNINGQEKGIDVVKFWAHSKEIAEYCPEDAAEARKIYNEIMRDIGKPEINVSQGKHPRFSGYIDQLNEIYTQHREAQEKLHNGLAKAEEELNNILRSGNSSESDKVIAHGRYEEYSKKVRHDLSEIQSSFTEEAKSLRSTLEQHVTELFRATPDKIDGDALTLINTGIMSVSDVEHMIEQFRHNPTMLKILAEYSADLSQKLRKAGKYNDAAAANAMSSNLKKVCDPANMFEGFDVLVARGEETINGTRKTHSERAWSTLVNGIRDSYDNYIVQASVNHVAP